jgi:hypothetical protein
VVQSVKRVSDLPALQAEVNWLTRFLVSRCNLRQKQGWTQFEMSERLATWLRWRLEIEVCLRNLALIAEAFDLKAWQLLKF